MRTYLLLLMSCFIGYSVSAQTNDTPANYYRWKGKKTEPQDGYFILKSGKKMTGKIVLKGSAGAIEEYIIVNDGKEITIPGGSITSYGLMGFSNNAVAGPKLAPPVADCDEEFFVMSSGASGTEGAMWTNTKPRNGYVVLQNGSKVVGDFKIRYLNGEMKEFVVKNDNGSNKYGLAEVKNYGLMLTVAEMTNDGKKIYDDQGRNFHPGTVVLTDGSVQEGVVGFYKVGPVSRNEPKMGVYYSGILIAPTKEGYLEPIPDNKVVKVTQEIYGVHKEYMSYEVGFVEKSQFDQIEFKDETRMFQTGSVTMDDGSTLEGQIAQQKGGFGWYSTSILYKDNAGNTRKLNPMRVAAFTQRINGRETKFMDYRGAFVELMHEGNNFQLFRNPYPTSVNKFLSGLTNTVIQTGAAVAGTVAQDKMIKNTLPDNASDDDVQRTIDEVQTAVKSMSVEQLQAEIQRCQDLKGPIINNGRAASPQNALLDQIIGICSTELAMRAIASSASVEIKKKEWIFLNRNTNEQTVVTADDYKDQVEPLLGSCPSYLTMSKKEQKLVNNFDAIEDAVKLLDACYDE